MTRKRRKRGKRKNACKHKAFPVPKQNRDTKLKEDLLKAIKKSIQEGTIKTVNPEQIWQCNDHYGMIIETKTRVVMVNGTNQSKYCGLLLKRWQFIDEDTIKAVTQN